MDKLFIDDNVYEPVNKVMIAAMRFPQGRNSNNYTRNLGNGASGTDPNSATRHGIQETATTPNPRGTVRSAWSTSSPKQRYRESRNQHQYPTQGESERRGQHGLTDAITH